MKKFLLIFCLLLVLTGCKDDVEDPIEDPIVIEKDEDAFHRIKHISQNNTIPHLIKRYDEMDDEKYGSFVIETYDSKNEMVWCLKWRDLEKKSDEFAAKPIIYEDLLIASVQGVISVHDLLTGTFLWELETSKAESNAAVFDGILYVLYYGEASVTGFDIRTGENVFELNGSIQNLSGIHVDDRSIIIYTETTDQFEKNGFEYSTSGEYLRKVHYEVIEQFIQKWDLVESSDESESSNLIIDGSLETVWNESVKGYGEKEWVEITKQLPSIVHKLIIYNGDHTSLKNYEENSKMKRAIISIGNGKSFVYEFDEFEFGSPTIIEFVKPITADYILITIESAEPGTMFKNTGITEVYTQ